MHSKSNDGLWSVHCLAIRKGQKSPKWNEGDHKQFRNSPFDFKLVRSRSIQHLRDDHAARMIKFWSLVAKEFLHLDQYGRTRANERNLLGSASWPQTQKRTGPLTWSHQPTFSSQHGTDTKALGPGCKPRTTDACGSNIDKKLMVIEQVAQPLLFNIIRSVERERSVLHCRSVSPQ